jgi:hypothetical protein
LEKAVKFSGKALTLALATTLSVVANDVQAKDIKRCLRFSFEDEFKEGQAYRRDIGNGLALRADPSQGGWHFEIGRAADTGSDDHFIYDVTLPLHGRHPTDLDTTYATPAQDAVTDEPVSFWFVAFPEDGLRAEHAQQLTHWPKTDDEEKKGWEELAALPKGHGQLEMLKWRLIPGSADAGKDGDAAQYGAIQWLQFRLTLTVPVGYTLPTDASGTPIPCAAEEKNWPFDETPPPKQ